MALDSLLKVDSRSLWLESKSLHFKSSLAKISEISTGSPTWVKAAITHNVKNTLQFQIVVRSKKYNFILLDSNNQSSNMQL